MQFLFKHLTENYNREKQLITEKDYDSSYIITVEEVLKAHYLICEYFENDTGEISLYGIKNYNLLSSAVARQSVSLGNAFKYKTNIEKAATVFYGLVKNHPFHDGNKRTGLLILLYFLIKIGRRPCVKQKEFEKLTEIVASDEYAKYINWNGFIKNNRMDLIDLKIQFISKLLNKYTKVEDNSYVALTYRELDTMIHQYGFFLEPCGSQEINLYHKKKNFWGKEKCVKLYQVGFKGWTKQIKLKSFKCLMKEINKIEDIDVGTITSGAEPMYKLIEEFSGPLSRLRDK